MNPLTKEEKAWIKKVQALLNKCPSKRMAGAATGDCGITLYDTSFEDKIDEIMDKGIADFVPTINKLECKLGTIVFPFVIHSTAS